MLLLGGCVEEETVALDWPTECRARLVAAKAQAAGGRRGRGRLARIGPLVLAEEKSGAVPPVRTRTCDDGDRASGRAAALSRQAVVFYLGIPGNFRRKRPA